MLERELLAAPAERVAGVLVWQGGGHGGAP
jgi:hypothetical protein